MNSTYVDECNKLSSAGAWIWLLEITNSGYSTLRYTNNNENVAWGGNTYTRMPFIFTDVEVSTSGKFPDYGIEIGEVATAGTIRQRIIATNGMPSGIARLMLVHSEHLSLTTAALEEYAEILSCELTDRAIVLNMGMPSLSNRRFPLDRYVPSYCRHKFKGALCGYAQPSYYVDSDNVVFLPLVEGQYDAAHPVDRISFLDVNIVTSVFQYAKPSGTVQGASIALAKDTGITITGSLYNDGFYLVENWYGVSPTHLYAMKGTESGRSMTAETVLTGVRLQLGYSGCDHTLEACKLRDNSQNFGGSPGIAGGIYG